MNRMYLCVLVCSSLFASSMLVGCASVQKQDNKVYAESKPDQALVYFLREKKFAGSVIRFNIRANDEIIGALANGTYFFQYFEPQTITFSAKTEASSERTLTLEKGGVYYIKGGVDMGMFAGRPSLTIVDVAEGRALLPQLTYATK